MEVLVEGPSKTGMKQNSEGPRQLTGRTMTDHITVFDGNPRLTGNLVRLKIEDATAFTLFGKVLTTENNLPTGEETTSCDTPTTTQSPGRISLEVLG